MDPAAPRIPATAVIGSETVTVEPLNTTTTVYLLRTEHPQIQLTWASRFPSKVDKLKLRKEIKVFPIQLTLKADYDTNTREFDYGCSARDTILGGNFSLSLADQRLDYVKYLAMPNGACIALNASCKYVDKTLRPDFGIQLEFGGDTSRPEGHANAVWIGNMFDIQQRFDLFRGIGVEVCGSLKLPTPQARYSANAGTLALGEGAFHVHVAEVNAIVRI